MTTPDATPTAPHSDAQPVSAPEPSGSTTPPAEAVEVATLAAIEYRGGRCQRRLDYCTTHASWFDEGSLVCRRLARDLELVGYAVAALDLPTRDRETAAKALDEAAAAWSDWDALDAPEDWLRDRASALREGRQP